MTATNCFLALVLLLGVSVSCKKQTDSTLTPSSGNCQLQKITYSDGGYDTLIYNADGFVTKSRSYYVDQTGKLVSYGGQYTYTNQGLLERVTPFADGQTPAQDSYEQFTYANGALSKIEITELGKLVYRFDITTNANKQITSAKGISFDQATYSEYTGTHTLDAQGRYAKSEGTDANGLFYRMESGDFNATIKTYHSFLKGWPVNVMNYWHDYGVNTPINGNGAFLKRAYYHGYDENGKFVGLRKLYDITHTYKTNSYQYATEMTTTNSATPSANAVLTKYLYANCN